MPLTEFQRAVLLLLRKHRNPNSYVAGGVAIHRLPTSIRQSNDIDFFHDTDEAVAASAKSDLEVLGKNRFQIEILIQQPSFLRAVISRGDDTLKLDWARDTAFRFFPVMEDDDLGYRLHDADLTINKCLALANRNEVRDIIDLLQLDREVISLAAACWAACGKDPGFTPRMLVDCMRRHSIIRPEQLDAELVTEKIAPAELKKRWLNLLEPVDSILEKLPAEELGCLYIEKNGSVVSKLDPLVLPKKSRHFGTLGGSWPQVSGSTGARKGRG